MITELTIDDIGRWVTYRDSSGKVEKGKIKGFDNNTKTAWVVYHCNNNWENDLWHNYTAAATYYSDISF